MGGVGRSSGRRCLCHKPAQCVACRPLFSPALPCTALTLPASSPLSYIHGGYELTLNSLMVPYFKASKLLGATVFNRHSLEVRSWEPQRYPR